MCKTKNIHNYDARKVAKCQDAKLNGLGVIKKNLRYVESAPPPPDRVKSYRRKK